MGKQAAITRRDFFTRVGQGAALAATGGLVWSYLLKQQAAVVRNQYVGWRPPNRTGSPASAR